MEYHERPEVGRPKLAPDDWWAWENDASWLVAPWYLECLSILAEYERWKKLEEIASTESEIDEIDTLRIELLRRVARIHLYLWD